MVAARKNAAAAPSARAKIGVRPLVPEVLRALGALLGERAHQLVRFARRQALALELLQLALGDLGADLTEARVLFLRQADGLRAAVDQELLADRVERVPAFTDLLLHALDRVVEQLPQVRRQLA